MANKYITKELLAKHKGINLDRIFQYSDLDLKIKYKKYASNLEGNKLKLYLESFDRAISGIRPGQLCTVIMPPNVGKLLTLDTVIPALKGNKTMNSLRLGEKIFGKDGKPTKINFISSVQRVKCYEIIFDDKVRIECCEDHLWEVSTQNDVCNSHKRRKGDYSIKKRIMKTSEMFKVYRMGNRSNLSIGVCKPVEYQKKKYSIPPYILGLWLGDGSKSYAAITNTDEYIINKWKEYANLLKMETRVRGGITYYIANRNRGGNIKNKLLSNLRKLKVLNNKHIPEKYYYGSIRQRLELLQGLMDTDGWVSKQESRYCQFSNTNYSLAYGVKRLVSSLGAKAHISSKIPKLNGKECKRCYNVTFKMSLPAFQLKRKLELQDRKLKLRQIKRTIRKMNYIGFRDGKCIQVDNKEHLYLCSEFFVPTHNTTYGLNICYNQVKDENSIRANGKLVVFLGMETSDYELYERMIQMEFGIDTKEIEKKYDEARGCDEEFISRVDKIVKNWDGIVNVVYRIGIHEIIPYISALKEVFNKDVGALIIDYLGLIKHPTAKTDYQKITDVMQELKELALSLMIPVLNFSTTGREEVKDKKKRLSLFSGKGSGEIEGSSQIVITMERVNELEGVVADDVVKAVQRQETDILEAIIQKKKQGKYAKILVELNKESLLMSEYIKPPNIQEERKPF